jgi:hypothetical protein
MTTRHRRPPVEWSELRRRYGRGLPWSIAGVVTGSVLFGYMLGATEGQPPPPDPKPTVSQHRPAPSRPVSGLGKECPHRDSCELVYRDGGWHIDPTGH